LLTQVTASILATCPEAIGVLWFHAASSSNRLLFPRLRHKILPGGLPLYIWVDFRVAKTARASRRASRPAWKSLGHMEFETEDSSRAARASCANVFFGLANYVLDNGPVIRDGDTTGKTPTSGFGSSTRLPRSGTKAR